MAQPGKESAVRPARAHEAPPDASPAHYRLGYYLKRTVIYALTLYLLLCLALFVFQRKLIYVPVRDAAVDPARAGLPRQSARNVAAQAADGVPLGGWQLLPADASAPGPEAPDFDAALADGRPVAVFFHGNGGHRGHRAEALAGLARRGLHVAAFDYRGYGDSGGEPSEDGIARDAQAVLAWLGERGVRPERIVLVGESLGCAVCVRLAEEARAAGAPPAGLILLAPFTSLSDAAASLYWFVPVRLLLRERYPSLERIGRVDCPLLVVHGRRDRVVPFEQGRRLFEAAPEQSTGGVEKVFVEIPDAGHNDLRAWPEYEKALDRFFENVRMP
ncbi:MAG: alpha/beta hydrolase [Planctomycetota bacterium]|nr:alpha/beta hydrolase [Planctomycetota bacterium]